MSFETRFTEAEQHLLVTVPSMIGSSMACNKVRGIRAALCYDLRTVVNSREHNNANVMTLGGPLHDAGQLCEMVRVWLQTRFPGGRHLARVNKIMALERGGEN